MKAVKANKQFHSSDSKIGKGISHGTGLKNPVGKSKEIMGVKPMVKSQMGKPPKSMA